MLGIAIGGFGVLIALGVLIGRALDRKAQDDAWRRIATARRINAERARRLDDLEAGPSDEDDALDVRDPPAGRPSVVRMTPPPEMPGSTA